MTQQEFSITQDLIKGVELADGIEYDATIFNNLVDQCVPHPTRGMILVTQDIGSNVYVPDPGDDPDAETYKFKRYLWLRLDTSGTPTAYVWDENADSDAILLKWTLLVSSSTLTEDSFPAGVIPAGALADGAVLGVNLSSAIAGPGLQMVSNQLTVKPDNTTIEINRVTGSLNVIPQAVYAPPIGATFWSPKQISGIDEKGWLLMNGQSLSRASYPELFAIYNDTFGSADTDHFNLPDMSGRFALGANFSHLEGTTQDAEQITLEDVNLPEHTHLVVVHKSVLDFESSPQADLTNSNSIQSLGGKEGGSFSSGDLNREYVLSGNADDPDVGITSVGPGTATPIDVPLPPYMSGVWYVYAKTP